MSKHTITDKDVVYQIAQILVRQFSHFTYPQDKKLEEMVEELIVSGAAPLMSYKALATELNQVFNLTEAQNKFTPLNIDYFLGLLLKESIDFSYKIEGVSHLGRIKKKIGRDVPITAIVVNSKTHLPGKQFFSYFAYPYATEEEMRASTVKILCDLLTFYYWPDYLKRVEKIFG